MRSSFFVNQILYSFSFYAARFAETGWLVYPIRNPFPVKKKLLFFSPFALTGRGGLVGE